MHGIVKILILASFGKCIKNIFFVLFPKISVTHFVTSLLIFMESDAVHCCALFLC